MQFDETAIKLTTSAPASLEPGSVFDERYEIIEHVGDGVMSAVFHARHIALNLPVALKVLHPNLVGDTDAIKRFQREAVAIATLDHPNIAKILGSGVVDSRPYVSMEWIEGTSLKRIVKAEGPLPDERAIPLFCGVLDAIEHAWLNGIVHRGIRPSNVMITKDGVPKLLDFGVAKLLPESGKQLETLTRTGQLFGIFQYMSPEHCLGFPVDVRSDLYSMGCLMYETLTGESPIKGKTAMARVADKVEGRPHLPVALSPHMADVVMWTWEKDPDRRPQSASQLKEALLNPEDHRRSRTIASATRRVPISAVEVVAAAISLLAIIALAAYVQFRWISMASKPAAYQAVQESRKKPIVPEMFGPLPSQSLPRLDPIAPDFLKQLESRTILASQRLQDKDYGAAIAVATQTVQSCQTPLIANSEEAQQLFHLNLIILKKSWQAKTNSDSPHFDVASYNANYYDTAAGRAGANTEAINPGALKKLNFLLAPDN
jgi:serine/threonine protein kinase